VKQHFEQQEKIKKKKQKRKTLLKVMLPVLGVIVGASLTYNFVKSMLMKEDFVPTDNFVYSKIVDRMLSPNEQLSFVLKHPVIQNFLEKNNPQIKLESQEQESFVFYEKTFSKPYKSITIKNDLSLSDMYLTLGTSILELDRKVNNWNAREFQLDNLLKQPRIADLRNAVGNPSVEINNVLSDQVWSSQYGIQLSYTIHSDKMDSVLVSSLESYLFNANKWNKKYNDVAYKNCVSNLHSTLKNSSLKQIYVDSGSPEIFFLDYISDTTHVSAKGVFLDMDFSVDEMKAQLPKLLGAYKAIQKN